ncbi:PINIT domain-containing protein [Sporodiniella umbellata]|nr:PINIT domain-containing protein [Sporodiniella umbellata]
MTEMAAHITSDFRRATLRELVDCVRSINNHVFDLPKMTVSGKKEEVINRMTKFVSSILNTNKETSIVTLVTVINKSFSKKIHWRFENGTLSTSQTAFVKQPKMTIVQHVSFKKNPFFAPTLQLTQFQHVPISSDRSSKFLHFAFTEEHRHMLTTPSPVDGLPLYQLRFYCCKANGADGKEVLVEFPNVCEIRMNGNVIGGNALRGIKNKPGTVNPPDLTVMVRKGGLNSIEFVYFNTHEAYLCALYLVQRTPTATLIQSMVERELSKEAVLKRLQEKQQEDEVVLESETLSTKCPLAFSRITVPIRSIHCNHLQCFDANTFLSMNEQTPTWSCPVCYKKITNCDDLVQDGYFQEMLDNTPRHIENVKVEPDGHITVVDERTPSESSDGSDSEEQSSEVKEDVVELLDDDEEESGNNDTNRTIPHNRPFVEEPLPKKQKTDVIDLTLSDDDD